jgi:cytochrome c oxidase subunit III
MSETLLPHTFQYGSARHQSDSAIAGMWLFLASEMLFFGVLFLSWIFCRHWNPTGFDVGAQQTSLLLGTFNTVLLLTSSLTYTAGVRCIEADNARGLIVFTLITGLLGLAFLAVKFGLEWHEDFAKHLFPGNNFAIQGPVRAGAQLFFVFYFVATALHGLHMLVGIGLLTWIIWRAQRGQFSSTTSTPVEVVGLYWSFVDMVWVVLYPLIYLIGRSPPAVQPLILIAALAMLGVIATYVMKVGRGPILVRLFAAAGVLWLLILLALGSLDPLTRVAYPVTQVQR